MPDRSVPTLAELLDTPARALELGAAEAAGMLAAMEAAAAVLRIAAARPSANGGQGKASEDRLLTLEEGARIASVTAEQLRRRRCFRSAIVLLGHRTLRVNEGKLRAILRRMTGVEG